MNKLFLLIIISFVSLQVTAGRFDNVWVSPDHPANSSGGWVCSGDCGDLPAAALAVSSSNNYTRSSQQQKALDDKYESSHNFNKPRIVQALCSAESEQNTSNIERKTSSEYWATYDGGLVNDESLKEFFSITKNQYSTDCDDWFSQYMKLPFHKTLIFAYDKNLIDVTGYWALSLSTYHRSEAERFGIQACENSHKSHNFESFNCTVLFTNSQIMNKEYLDLAKMSNEEYNETIAAYENKISEVRVSQSELSNLFN